jgi:hypothetical protein
VGQNDRIALSLEMQNFSRQIISRFERNHVIKIIIPPSALSNQFSDFVRE